MTRLLPVVAVTLVFAWLLGGAIDYQLAQVSVREPMSRFERTATEGVSYRAPVVSQVVTSEPASLTGSSTRAASIRAIRSVFGARAPAAIRVASCETGGTFYARSVGSQGERGLFQIHPVHFGWAQPWRLFDPVWNSRVAYRLSRGGTRWGAWSCGWAA